MGVISKILNRINVFIAIYDNAGEYTLSLWECRMKGRNIDLSQTPINGELNKMKAIPALIVTGGYGVISKSVESSGDIIGQVTSDPEKFIWSYMDKAGRIVFIKREKVSGILETLEEEGLKTVGISCFDIRTQDIEAAVMEAAKAYYSDTATLRNICRPVPEGSAMAQMLFHKLKMPVLGMALGVLVVNAFVGPRIGVNMSAQRHELAALQRSIGKQSESDRNRQRVIAEFGAKLPQRYAVICDKIGYAVPDNIILTQLAVQPLVKAMEHGRKPQISERSAVMRGEAAGPDDVSALIKSLDKTNKFREIHLTSIDKERESGKTVFRIDAAL